MPGCPHPTLCFEASSHAAEAGYRRQKPQERGQAATYNGGESNPSQLNSPGAASFPGPLVLPGDDLSLDPDYPPQSLRQWLRDKDRNGVSPTRNVIYLAAPPTVQTSVDFMSPWTHPQQEVETATYPKVQHILDYLRAFYHGLPVRLLSSPALSFTGWNTETVKSRARVRTPRLVGLRTSTECIGIRTRASADGIFERQLNLDDLLDAAISILPHDAYALLLVVQHDLYENADDLFTCGRAYGGSRVAVISMARYHPGLDQCHSVEREHAWPASHCQTYVDALCAADKPPAAKRKRESKAQETISVNAVSHASSPVSPPSALQAAVSAHSAVLSSSNSTSSPQAMAARWLGRVCRTASHELGHCFGIDHCVYYACVMQGSASLAEDARQPLYLCPVDLAKLLHATGAYLGEHYAALLAFCEQHVEGEMFAALAAWVRIRMQELEGKTDCASG